MSNLLRLIRADNYRILVLMWVISSSCRLASAQVTAYQGTYFDTTLSATASTLPACSKAPCTYKTLSKLPDGLAATSSATGLELSGVPTTQGATSLVVYAIGDTIVKFSATLTVSQNLTNTAVPGAAAATTLPEPGYNNKPFHATVGILSGATLCPIDTTTALPANLKLDSSGNLTSDALNLPAAVTLQLSCIGAPASAAKFQLSPAVALAPIAAANVTALDEIAKLTTPPDKVAIPTDPAAPGTTPNFFYSLVGGAEQVDLSSLPSGTEPFVRLFIQSGSLRSKGKTVDKGTFRLWGSVRLLGAPNQNDTNGIFSVFMDPTGQITTEKLSSVGTATDFMFGPSFRIASWPGDTHNSVDLILGFGATTPLQSNQVTQAFVTPTFGTAECNILYNKFSSAFAMPVYSVQKSQNGIATGSTTACLLNTNAPTTSNGTTTYAPVNTLAFSNQDRTSFFLKDLLGIRFNHTAKADSSQDCSKTTCYLGTLDFSFGMDSAITGGVFRGDRWIFKTDAVYPAIVTGVTTIYVFGSFSTRLERNQTDNSPLILQAATLSTVTGTGSTAVPNVNTIVLPLRQPDRDFYRIGVGIDVFSLFKKKGS